MANKSKVQSVEPDIADLVNGWLKSYGLDYKLEQASLNSEIDKALDEYHSKIGGKGGNRPDAKLLLKDKYGTFYPVLIEYKGYKDKLVKLDTDGIVDNKKDKNEPNYTNIKSYAVNGAIHYANMLFLTCSMGKSIENKFSYGKKLRSSQSFKFKMQLPVKNEQPDYELMSTLISAIQKLVIADVVKFSDEKIKATKQVVG